VDQREYQRIRKLMRASVLRVWGGRGLEEVLAGRDPLDLVDEAWASMAASGFRCKGPFPAHACVVARNKALDAVRKAERKTIGPSIDAQARDDEGTAAPAALVEGSSVSAEDEFFAAQKLMLIEDAIYETLDGRERAVFLGVRVDRKSGAAVGRELNPPISGQRVGQILAEALIKIQSHVGEHTATLDPGA
jgi:RNA polymerase sigma factor (sigma-70 family)